MPASSSSTFAAAFSETTIEKTHSSSPKLFGASP
jgi:hypothetical protein